MTSGPITSRQIEGEKLETVTDFIFLISKITVDGDCSHKIKGHLLLRRKPMTNLGRVLKQRDIILFCFFNYYYFFIVVDFVIHRNETAMGLHVFPIPNPPPTSLSTQSL